MKIFSWVQNKLTSKKSDPVPSNSHIQRSYNEEIRDWPHGLLVIGTLGSYVQGVDTSNNEAKDRRDRRCACSDESNDEHENAVLVHSKRKDIGKKSLLFLLKKMFVYTSGFSSSPAQSLRDPIPPESPMEKILKTILQKKIQPQNSNPRLSTKRSSEKSHTTKIANGDEKADDGSRWVKTDSEYIVLEI